MENNNMEVNTKKKSSVGIILLIVILIIGCLAGGYFLSESGILKGDKENTEKSNANEEKEIVPVVTNYEVTDEKVANLINNLLKGGYSYGGCSALETFTNDKKVEAKDLSDLVIYHIIEINGFYNQKDSFSLDEFNAVAKKFFDSSYHFDPTAINYKGASCPQYNYDSGTQMFTKQQTACGGACGPMTSYKLVKAVDTDGVLKLDAKVIFTNYGNTTGYDYFSDYAKTNGIGKFNDDVNTLLDKGSNYQFTFKLVDGNYVYVSSEPIN